VRCADSYVRLSSDEMAVLARDAIAGIEKRREERRQELIRWNDEWKKKYSKANWLMRIFMKKPLDHPKDEEPFLGLNEWYGVDIIARKWEELASTLAAEKREVFVSASDLKALRGWTGRS